MPALAISKSLLYFLLAGFFEIGGGYLVWLWLREGKSLALGTETMTIAWEHFQGDGHGSGTLHLYEGITKEREIQ